MNEWLVVKKKTLLKRNTIYLMKIIPKTPTVMGRSDLGKILQSDCFISPLACCVFPSETLMHKHCVLFLDRLAEESQIRSHEYSNDTGCTHCCGMWKCLWVVLPETTRAQDPIHTPSSWERKKKQNAVTTSHVASQSLTVFVLFPLHFYTLVQFFGNVFASVTLANLWAPSLSSWFS